MELRRGIGLLLSVGILSLALGWTTGSAVSAGSRPPSDDQAGSATTLADPDQEGTDDTEAEVPVRRILLAGDSVMAGLAPALEAALGGGMTEVRFILTPSILRDATVRFTWEQELAEFDPEVVVMLVGTWELGEVRHGRGAATTGEDWRSVYDGQILDPWIELVTSRGSRVVWMGMPLVPSADVNLLFISLNEAYRALEDRWDSVRYLDSTRVLTAGSGQFTESLPTDDGRLARVRQVDGLHLCPYGSVMLADAVIAAISEIGTITENEGWRGGTWRESDEFPRESCPPME